MSNLDLDMKKTQCIYQLFQGKRYIRVGSGYFVPNFFIYFVTTARKYRANLYFMDILFFK